MNEELSHNGSESDFLGFAIGEEFLREIPQGGFLSGRDDGSHVESLANLSSSAVSFASATHGAAIVNFAPGIV